MATTIKRAAIPTPAKGWPHTRSFRPFVVVPRAVFSKYWPLPWAELKALAETGVDDLSVHIDNDTGPLWKPRHPDDGTDLPGWDDWKSLAFIREGDRDMWGKDRSILFQQNWGKND